MCGRATLSTPAEIIAALYDIDMGEMPDISPRYNIAPTQPVLTIRDDGDGRRASLFTWGFRDDRRLSINARSETVARLPAFRGAFQRRRCVVPFDGFYEWQTIGKRKQPFHFEYTGGGLFAVAALWTPAALPRNPARVVLLTAAARGDIARIHGRMPVVLPDPAVSGWLAPDTRYADLFAMLGDADASVVGTPVSTAVNDASHDGPDCIRPAPTFVG